MKPIKILQMAGAASGSGGGGGYTGGSLDTQTVTVGGSGNLGNGNRLRGWLSGSYGGISPGTSAVESSASIVELDLQDQGPGNGSIITFKVSGVHSNSGWTSMNIGGSYTLTRASATYSSSGTTSWSWAIASGNPFGGIGNVIVIGWD